MIKLKDLIMEKKVLLSRDEKIVINKYFRSSYGDKAGDLSTHEVKVGYSDDYRAAVSYTHLTLPTNREV